MHGYYTDAGKENHVSPSINVGRFIGAAAFFFLSFIYLHYSIPHLVRDFTHPTGPYLSSFALYLNFGWFRIGEPTSLWIALLCGIASVWAGLSLIFNRNGSRLIVKIAALTSAIFWISLFCPFY